MVFSLKRLGMNESESMSIEKVMRQSEKARARAKKMCDR